MKVLHTALLILWLSACGAAPAAAQAAEGAAARVAVSMDQAVKMVEQRFHARVVRAEAEHDGDRTVYVLRLLSDTGKVWTVHVDAASGSIS